MNIKVECCQFEIPHFFNICFFFFLLAVPSKRHLCPPAYTMSFLYFLKSPKAGPSGHGMLLILEMPGLFPT